MPRSVHLVGSVPLADSEAVFRTTAQILGARIKRMPDGETGARGDWVQWLTHLLRAHPQFDLPGAIDYSAARDVRNYYRVKPGFDPASVHFGALGYAEHARESFAVFSRLIDESVIPPATRFLVAMPTPLAFLQVLVAPDQRAALEQAYFESMMGEVAALAAIVPAEKLAIQWDTVFEVLILEGVRKSNIDDTRDGLIERLRRLGAALPAAAELGYHFCYGDMNHKHSLEPPHMGVVVDLANDLTRALPRRIDFIHMPVPRGRDDHPYFAPLSRLALRPETELFLGLVHFTDGAEGTRRRIAAAARVRRDFGIATECGFGRRQPETVRQLLQIHAEVAGDESAS